MRNLITTMLRKSDPFRVLLNINLEKRVIPNLRFKDKRNKIHIYNLSLRMIHDYLKLFL